MKVLRSLKWITLIILSLFSLSTLANRTPHTWHTVSTTDGTWNATLQMIHEGGSFVDRTGSSLTTFTIHPNQSQDFGFVLDEKADFNLAYTLTLVKSSKKISPQFTSKACVYVITASGPARPDVRPSSFNGAQCDWKVVHGVGEDFSVS